MFTLRHFKWNWNFIFLRLQISKELCTNIGRFYSFPDWSLNFKYSTPIFHFFIQCHNITTQSTFRISLKIFTVMPFLLLFLKKHVYRYISSPSQRLQNLKLPLCLLHPIIAAMRTRGLYFHYTSCVASAGNSIKSNQFGLGPGTAIDLPNIPRRSVPVVNQQPPIQQTMCHIDIADSPS